jgi:hypothetical protein
MDYIKTLQPTLVFAIVLILFVLIQFLCLKLWNDIKIGVMNLYFESDAFKVAGLIILWSALQAGTFTCAFWIMKQL